VVLARVAAALRPVGLGRRCTYWVRRCRGALSTNYRSRLIDRRNAATHSGHTVLEDEVRDAIAVAAEIATQAIPSRLRPRPARCRPAQQQGRAARPVPRRGSGAFC